MPDTATCPQCQQALGWSSVQQPHQRPDGTRCVFVIIYATHFLESDIHDGDYPRDDVRQEITDCLPDEFDLEDELEAPDLAAKVITNAGLWEASDAGGGTRCWWSSPDGMQIVDYATGEMVEESAHLYGFTEAEATAVYDKIEARSRKLFHTHH
jgi:hypothetical protein